MIKSLVLYLVIVSKFKQNECSPTKEQEINPTESIEKQTEEPIWPLSYETQEDDEPVETNRQQKRKKEEILKQIENNRQEEHKDNEKNKPLETNRQQKYKENENNKSVESNKEQKYKEKESNKPVETNRQQKREEEEKVKLVETNKQQKREEEEKVKVVETNRQQKREEEEKVKPVETYRHQKQKEVEKVDLIRKSEKVEPDENKMLSTKMNNFSAEKDETKEESTEIKTVPKENDNKTTELNVTEQNVVELKAENKENLLKDAENKLNVTKNETRRASNSKETIIEDLSEVAKVINTSASSRLPFPLLTMDHVLYNKTAQLIKMVQNEAAVSRDQKPSVYYPVNRKTSLDSKVAGSKNKPSIALRRTNRVRKFVEPEIPKRRYIISNFDVLESYMKSRRSNIDTSLGRKSIIFNKQDLGLDSDEDGNKDNFPQLREDDTNLKGPSNKALNYDDKSDDYIITTNKHNMWDYEHETWAVATETVNWDNVESSGERERESNNREREIDDKFSLEKKEFVEEEHEILRSKETVEDKTFAIKKTKNKKDGLVSLNIDTNTKKDDCDDKDIVVKIKTIPEQKDTRTYDKARDSEKGKIELKPNKHVERYAIKERNVNSKHFAKIPKHDDGVESREKFTSLRHKKRKGPKRTHKKRADFDNNDEIDIRHRVDMERDIANKQPSKRNFDIGAKIPSRLSKEENSETSLMTNSQNLTKRMVSIPLIRQIHNKQRDIGFRSKIPNESINKMEHRFIDKTDKHETTERPSNHQRPIMYRSEIKTFDHDSKSFLKRTIDDVAKSTISKKKEKKVRAFEDDKDNHDINFNEKKIQVKNIDWQDNREAKSTENGKGDISLEAIHDKNKKNMQDQWDRHANNDWDKVGIDKDKQEVSRPTLKRVNDKNGDKDFNNPRETIKDNDMAHNQREGTNIKWSEERNDRKKEISKSPSNGPIDMDYNQFEKKKPKIYPLDHDENRQEKSKFSGEAIKSRNKNIHWQDDYRDDDYRTNKKKSHNYNDNNNEYRDNRDDQTTKNRIVRDEFSREGKKDGYNNKRNTNEPFDRHANNDWDNVGIDNGKKETTRRTTKRYNDYKDYEPERSHKGYEEVTTYHSYKAENQNFNRHENNNWDAVGVEHGRKDKVRSRSRIRDNVEPRFVGTRLPFRQGKSIYDSDR